MAICHWTKKTVIAIKLCGLGMVLLSLVGCISQSENATEVDSESILITPAHVDLSTTPTTDRPKTLPSKGLPTPLQSLLPTPNPTPTTFTMTATPSKPDEVAPSVGISVRINALSPIQAKPGESIQLQVYFIGPPGFLKPEIHYAGAMEPHVLDQQLNGIADVSTWEWIVREDASAGEATVVVMAAIANTFTDQNGVTQVELDNPPLAEDWEYSDSVTFMVIKK